MAPRRTTKLSVVVVSVVMLLLAIPPAWDAPPEPVCCLASSAASRSDWPGETVPIALYIRFEEFPPPIVSEVMEREVESILSPLGLPIKWGLLDGVHQSGFAVELAVVKFRGGCNPDSRMRSRMSGPLGWTAESEGAILPFVEVDCDRIRDMVHRELGGSPPFSEFVLGRALGRVVAHELYHVFAQTDRHAPEGLAKAYLTDSDLTKGGVRFQKEEYRSLRAAMSQARLAFEVLRGRSEGSPTAGKYVYQESGCSKCHGSRGQGTRSGPALRGKGKSTEFKTRVESLAKGLAYLHGDRANRLPPPSLEKDEIEDLASFLNGLE
jgi:mono/diheme cytochrome c family protein